MLLKTQNKVYANQIASLYCGNNSLCNAGVMARLNYLTDAIFEGILIPTLNSNRFVLAWITSIVPQGPSIAKVNFSIKDLITGSTDSGYINGVNHLKLGDLHYVWNIIGRTYHGSISTPEGIRQVTLTKGDGIGYNIALTTTPVNGGSGSGSGGTATIKPVQHLPLNIPAGGTTGGDISGGITGDLLLYGAIGLGLYFLLK